MTATTETSAARTRDDLEREKLQRECDKLAKEVQQLSRAWYKMPGSWAAMLTALVAVGGVLIQAGYSNREYQLASIKKERAEYETQKVDALRSAYKTEISGLTLQKQNLLSDNDSLAKRNQELAASYSSKLQNENRERSQDAAKVATEAGVPGNTASIAPRVYILINSESQRAMAERASDALQAKGVLVPFIKVNHDSPDRTTLKYFDLGNNEPSEAEHLAEALRATGVDVHSKSMPTPRNKTVFRPRHYELWFARVV